MSDRNMNRIMLNDIIVPPFTDEQKELIKTTEKLAKQKKPEMTDTEKNALERQHRLEFLRDHVKYLEPEEVKMYWDNVSKLLDAELNLKYLYQTVSERVN